MELWGADDCYFAEEEICQILGMSVADFRDWIRDFSIREPEMYSHFESCRRESAHQLKFENNIRNISGEYLDNEFQWNRDQEFITNDANATDRFIKRKTKKNLLLDDDNPSLEGN